MSERTLLFDVGNTRVKWGLFERGRISRTGEVTHEKLQQAGYAPLTTRLPRNVDRILVSNVAGVAFGTRLSGVLGIHCDADISFAHTKKEGFGITCAYKQPRRLGVDRWVAMIGARAEFRSALCVVDAGTAVTIDTLDRHGRHLGGQIIPGIDLMGASLATNTSDLPAVARSRKPAAAGMEMFAATTRGGIRNGAMNAVCGAIDRAARTMRAAGHRPKVVLTGGDASRILKQLDGNVILRPNLVLQGLARIAENRS